MRTVLFALISLFIITSASAKEDFYDLKAKKIDGDTLYFSELEGKKLMIVNTASYCSYTYQYEDLQELYELYGGPNFEIIGFPANNFNNQEPGSDEDIMEFCEGKGVTFTMMSKISVVGADQHPVYQWLTQKNKNGVQDSEVMWNFQKYLIDGEGNLVGIVSTPTNPMDQQIIDWLDPSSNIEVFNNEEICIFPNPATDYIEISGVNQTISDNIQIYNSLGQIVLTYKYSDNQRINLTNIPVGLYYLKINDKFISFIKI